MEVTGIHKSLATGGKPRVTGVTISSGQQIDAPIIINASGPHSKFITALAYAGIEEYDDMTIRTRPLRVEVAYAPSSKILGDDGVENDYLEAGGPVIGDLDTGVYIRPEIGGKILAGGTEPECDSLDFVDSPDSIHQDSPTSSTRITCIVLRCDSQGFQSRTRRRALLPHMMSPLTGVLYTINPLLEAIITLLVQVVISSRTLVLPVGSCHTYRSIGNRILVGPRRHTPSIPVG